MRLRNEHALSAQEGGVSNGVAGGVGTTSESASGMTVDQK